MNTQQKKAARAFLKHFLELDPQLANLRALTNAEQLLQALENDPALSELVDSIRLKAKRKQTLPNYQGGGKAFRSMVQHIIDTNASVRSTMIQLIRSRFPTEEEKKQAQAAVGEMLFQEAARSSDEAQRAREREAAEEKKAQAVAEESFADLIARKKREAGRAELARHPRWKQISMIIEQGDLEEKDVDIALQENREIDEVVRVLLQLATANVQEGSQGLDDGWEIPPEAEAQLIPAPGTIPPENTLEADGKLDTPEFGEEKQPDYANQVDQNPAVGFQALGIPDEGDLSREQKLAMLRRALPNAPPDVLATMVDNSDFGSLQGQRENIGDQLVEGLLGEEKKEAGVVVPQLSQQAMARLAQQLQQGASGITATSSAGALRQATRGAFTRGQQQTADQVAREIEELEKKNPGLADRIGVIAAQIWENLPSIPESVRGAIPWLALNIAGSIAGRSLQPVKPGGIDYVTIGSLIASLAAAGFNVPEPVRDFVQGEGTEPRVMRPGERPPAGQGGQQGAGGGQQGAAGQPPRILRPGERPPPGAEGKVPVDENLRDSLGEHYRIPRGADIDDLPQEDINALVDDVGADTAAEIIAFVTRGVVAGGLMSGFYQHPRVSVGVKVGVKGGVHEKAVSIKQSDDPGTGDLRPTFQLLGTDEDTETKEEKLDEQLKFATFGYVLEGSGNGKDNPLYLQNKAWDNLVRFVNNYVPAVDRLSANQMRSFQTLPEQICKASVLEVNPSVARDRRPPADWGMVDAFEQPAVMRNGLDTWDLEDPNIPLARVAPPTTNFAGFKATNQVENPVEGTRSRAVPRGLYSNPSTQAGKEFNTGFTTGKSMLLNVPEPEPIAFTEVNTVERSKPQEPFWKMYETINV